MADLIMLPKTSDGYKYLLVVMDLAKNDFDIEPLKSKDASATVLAFKKMIKRKWIKLPDISLKTDGGTEFGSEFHKFLLSHKIFHKIAMPYRHTQMAPVESLNRSLTRF